MQAQAMRDVPHFHIKQTPDIDVHADNLSAWEQRYEQTSPGPFCGVVRELVHSDLQLFEETGSCATAQHCQPWAAGIWLGLMVSDTGSGLRFMGQATAPADLMLACGDQPFELLVPAHCGLYGVVLSREELGRHLQELHGVALPQDWFDVPRTQPLLPLQRYRLAGMLREILRSVQATPEVLTHHASTRMLREALMTVLSDTLLPTLAEPAKPRQQRRSDLVRRATRVVQAQAAQALSVAALCSQLHVTRRTLQNSFQEALGMSPAAYLRTLRLNAVRRALKERNPATTTIADLAAQSGFWHMGHFCQEYKALFGETPSQTPHRSSSDNSRPGRTSPVLPVPALPLS